MLRNAPRRSVRPHRVSEQCCRTELLEVSNAVGDVLKPDPGATLAVNEKSRCRRWYKRDKFAHWIHSSHQLCSELAILFGQYCLLSRFVSIFLISPNTDSNMWICLLLLVSQVQSGLSNSMVSFATRRRRRISTSSVVNLPRSWYVWSLSSRS